MKKVMKYFLFAIFCLLVMFFASDNTVEANYDASKNFANVAVSKNEVKITVTYQKGIDKEYSSYQWCKKPNAGTVIKSLDECIEPKGNKVEYVKVGGDTSVSYIASGDASYVDNNLTTYTFTVSKAKDPFLSIEPEDGGIQNTGYYAIVVSHYFCERRFEGNTSCAYTDFDNVYTVLDVNGSDLRNGKTIGGTGSDIDEIEDEGLRSMMDKVYDIVHGTVMPIIWAVLGLFLLIKGTLLGVQIVKSADEPQVRQEKIGSMKWLVIGVAIAYASTFVVDLVIGFFSSAFN